MRVVIEFSGSGWSGIVNAESTALLEAPFEGRLDLLRLLEALVDRPPDDHHDDR